VPAEVLVMCTRCRRPQPARRGPCGVCGEPLPDAPMPGGSAPGVPFLLLEVGGHTIAGMDKRLTYQASASAAPVAIELDKVRGVSLGRRLFLEALGLVLIALVLALLVPSLRPVAAGLSGLGVLGALLWRRYSFLVVATDGGRLRWPLGVVRLGSGKARLLDAAWTSGADALASRGVAVQERSGGLGPGA
jgi:hypothetical protein